MESVPMSSRLVARHPIAVVSERTGLSQDVLRVWERRYGAVTPIRGSGGQRLYTDEDIERLNLLQVATRGGRSISQVATLSAGAISALVDEDSAAVARRPSPSRAVSSADGGVVSRAIGLARSLDAAALDESLRRALATMGVPAFLEHVAAPLLRRMGDEWHAGRLAPSQEHLVSAILHDIIVASMREFTKKNGGAKLLVATPAGDRHAIGAALVGAAAATEGWNVVYLGADLPAAEIADAAEAADVRIVAISMVYVDDRDRMLAELRTLRSRLPARVAIIAGGAAASALADALSEMDIRVQTSIPGLLAELRRYAPAA